MRMSYILTSSPTPWHVSSYGMEADPPRFVYLKKNPCDFDLKVSEEVGVGMEQRKILDQYLTSGNVSTRSIQRVKRYLLLKTLTRNVSVKFQSP